MMLAGLTAGHNAVTRNSLTSKTHPDSIPHFLTANYATAPPALRRQVEVHHLGAMMLACLSHGNGAVTCHV